MLLLAALSDMDLAEDEGYKMSFLTVDQNWLIIDADDISAHFYGLKKGELVHQNFLKLRTQSVYQAQLLPQNLIIGTSGRFFIEQLVADNKRILVTVDWHVTTQQDAAVRILYIHTTNTHGCNNQQAHICETRTSTLLTLYQMGDESREADVLHYVLEACLKITESEFGFIAEVDADNPRIIRPFWSQNLLENCPMRGLQCQELEIPDGGFLGKALFDVEPVIVNDYRQAKYFADGCPLLRKIPDNHHMLERFLLMSVLNEKKPFFLVGMANRATDYTENDVHQLTLMLSGLMNHMLRLRKKNELEEEKKRVEEESLAKSRFLANMSHEIRTPMNGIMGMVELALQLELSPELLHYLSIIKSSATSLLSIINDILDISRIESGKFSLLKENFSLRTTVNTIVGTLQPLAAKKKLSLSVFVDEAVEDCFSGDALRLQQILFNLLGNALKFTQRGFCELWIQNCCTEKKQVVLKSVNQTCLHFIIKDSGIGIQENKLDKIFDLFTQVDEGTTRRFDGSGLGLSICKNLVEMMGGEISVQSNVGIGSSFSFYIVLEQASSACPTDVVDRNQKANKVQSPPLRILVVEDNFLNQQVISAYLKSHKHSYEIAVNGKDALLTLGKEKFDIILMDVEMPIMDGITATKLIRKNEGNLWSSDIPIILLTAHALKGDKERFLSVGANGYLPKPLNFAELDQLILEVMPESDNAMRAEQADDKIEIPVVSSTIMEIETRVDSKAVVFLDKKKALAAIENDEGLLKEILHIFLLEAVENMESLKKLSQVETNADNCNTARILIHSIKGAAFSIGATVLGDRAAEIEAFFKAGQYDLAYYGLNGLIAIFDETVELVKKECEV